MSAVLVLALLAVTAPLSRSQSDRSLLPTFKDPYNFDSSRDNDYDKCVDTCGQRQWLQAGLCYDRTKDMYGCQKKARRDAEACVVRYCESVRQKMIFLTGAGNILTLPTADTLHDYNLKDFKSLRNVGIYMAGRNSTLFSVKAEKDAFITLSSDPYNFNSDTYLVFIGRGGSKNGFCKKIPIIMAGFDDQAMCNTVSETSFLSANSFVSFWITWKEIAGGMTKLEMGSGDTEGQASMGSVDYPTYGVFYQAIATGWGTTGLWKLDKALLKVRSQKTCTACCGGCVIKDVFNQPLCPGGDKVHLRYILKIYQDRCNPSSEKICNITYSMPEYFNKPAPGYCCEGSGFKAIGGRCVFDTISRR